MHTPAPVGVLPWESWRESLLGWVFQFDSSHL